MVGSKVYCSNVSLVLALQTHPPPPPHTHTHTHTCLHSAWILVHYYRIHVHVEHTKKQKYCSFYLERFLFFHFTSCFFEKISQNKHLLWFRFHQSKNTALMGLKVSIQKRWPAISVQAVHLMFIVHQKLDTFGAANHCCKMETWSTMTVLRWIQLMSKYTFKSKTDNTLVYPFILPTVIFSIIKLFFVSLPWNSFI